VRHGHVPNYWARDLQTELAGIQPSRSFLRQPEANGTAERFTRSPKGSRIWVQPFAAIE
jgi:hypothetical protein